MEQNTQKITPALMREKELVFYPKTRDEAIFIQQKLFDMGGAWAGSDPRKIQKVDEIVEKGLLAERGTIYYNPGTNPNYQLATSAQFDVEYLSPEQSFQMEMFNKIAKRLDELSARVEQVAEKVDRMHDEMFPTTASTKPKLKAAP